MASNFARWAACFAVVTLTTTGTAQGLQPYGREAVVRVDSTTSAEVLQARARRWFVDAFKDAGEVVHLDDPTSHTIVGKGISTLNEYAWINFAIEVACKEGRYRCRIYDVKHEGRRAVYVNGLLIDVPSYGQVFDDTACYIPQRGYLQGAQGAERDMLRNCEVLRPLLSTRFDDLLSSLQKAMTATASPSDEW